jgi:DNA-binding transcriptional MerR regulator
MPSIKPSSPEAPRATLRIGELARRAGRTVHAIRWYESIGLVPGVRRDSANRRVYDEMHIGWLELVDRLRITGMSTKQMQEYATLIARGRATLNERRNLLAAHRTHVREMIDEWQAALALLDRKVDFYDNWMSTGRRPSDPIANARPPKRRRSMKS